LVERFTIDLADNYHRVLTGIDEWWGKVATENADGSGLLYRRHRTMNSGQFTQEDPIGLAGGLNAYGFAAGDRVNYSDPFGLQGCKNGDVWCVIGRTGWQLLGGLTGCGGYRQSTRHSTHRSED
jgi:RHS repeat-associated protein